MVLKKILIANRGEIAVRVIRTASDMGIDTVAVYARDDARAMHVRMAGQAVALQGDGASAYLNAQALIDAARLSGCDAVHPGYGFLSENEGFANAVRLAGLTFIGPSAETLALFGDKVSARRLAIECDVPVLPGTDGATTLEQAHAFFATLEGHPMMIKAVAGGGGRGMRIVRNRDEIDQAFERCRSEARNAFGCDEVYVEQCMSAARHIEIQIVGDGQDVVLLGERECSLQRRQQKLVEIAPSPSISERLRTRLGEAALRIARRVQYQSLGTVEFLVFDSSAGVSERLAFLEVNPRIQVEHTVTEQVLGLDIVRLQLDIAAGAGLDDIGLLSQLRPAAGFAVQLRVNMETLADDGSVQPASGEIAAFEPPGGPGVRVDTAAYPGYAPSPRYDSLLAKVIVHSPSNAFGDVIRRAQRALAEFTVDGVQTNIPLLRRLLEHPRVVDNDVHTRFVDEFLAELAADGELQALRGEPGRALPAARPGAPDSLGAMRTQAPAPEGSVLLSAPMQGTVVSIDVREGEPVAPGQQVLVLEAMKMEHAVCATTAGIISRLDTTLGETVTEGAILVCVTPGESDTAHVDAIDEIDLDFIRPDLAELLERRAGLYDERRPDAVARRRRTGQRTARENIADLLDADSFVEYGGLALAAQRQRRTLDTLIEMSPADGLITGIGTVNAAHFGVQQGRCAVMAYDYTVFAGTQGVINHKKTDRQLLLAEKWKLPLVLFAEGGGGRPGDEWPAPVGFDIPTFSRMGALSGLVPTVGIASGRCFAGNAALLGSCDVVIATADSNIGIGGPAMIEGGGLGVYQPAEIGPVSVQVASGVIDVLVRDEAEATAVARRYLGYFQGDLAEWTCADQRWLRHAIPENRMRSYDVRALIAVLADTDSVLELRPGFGEGMITALIRLEGRPVGLIANNSRHLGGAIDADGADKAARFMRLCNAFDLPIVSLCDTPGMMVGPDVERTAQVRHVSRMFVAAANLRVPVFTVVLRKGYGLGALAMTMGCLHSTFMMLAWPTAEFGAMGHEGGIRLGFKREMAAIADPHERQAWYERMVAKAYEDNKALSSASFLDVDDVIDPRETRERIVRAMRCVPPGRNPDISLRVGADVW